MPTLTNNTTYQSVLQPNQFSHDHERYDDIKQGFFEAMRAMHRYECMDSAQENEEWSINL